MRFRAIVITMQNHSLIGFLIMCFTSIVMPEIVPKSMPMPTLPLNI